MEVLWKIVRVIKEKNTLMLLRIRYGKRFCYKKIRTNGGLRVSIGESAVCKIGSAFFNYGCSINILERLEIGEDCIFGEGIRIYDHNHIYKSRSVAIYKQGFSTDGIVIGNNVWIGSNTVILKGVHIGNNVVIGANCLVYKDIPDDSLVKCNSGLSIIHRT